MQLSINNKLIDCDSIEQFSEMLEEIDHMKEVEVWLSVQDGPAICLLKSNNNSFLMYLREEGDSGFTTVGDPSQEGTFFVRLANGQIDKYPLSWCIEPEAAYKGLAYFFVNEGARTPHLYWQES